MPPRSSKRPPPRSSPATGPRPDAPVRPLRSAVVFAGAYLAVCLPYIWFSGRLAAALAPDVQVLEMIERVKGQAFVLLTGLLLFAASYAYLRRIADQQRALLEHERQLARAERVAMAGVMAAATCHDANNALTAVRGNLELVADEPGLGAEGRDGIDRALRSCDRMSATLRRLLDLSRSSLPGRTARQPLAPLVREVLELGGRHRALQPHLIGWEVAEDVEAAVNAELLTGALLNLLLNAGEAMPAPGEIRIVVRADAGETTLEVHDAGPGVPEELHEKILEPFFTTRDRGSGLGLLSARACALEHGGRLEIGRSPLLGGAVFRLVLPRRPAGGPAA